MLSPKDLWRSRLPCSLERALLLRPRLLPTKASEAGCLDSAQSESFLYGRIKNHKKVTIHLTRRASSIRPQNSTPTNCSALTSFESDPLVPQCQRSSLGLGSVRLNERPGIHWIRRPFSSKIPTTRSTRVRRSCALDLFSPVIQEVADRRLQRNFRVPIGFGPYLCGIPKDLGNIIGTDSSRISLDVNGSPADCLECTYDIPETDGATGADVIDFTGSAFTEQCNIRTYHIANVSEVAFNLNVSDHELGRAQTRVHFSELLSDRRQYEARRLPWAGMVKRSSSDDPPTATLPVLHRQHLCHRLACSIGVIRSQRAGFGQNALRVGID